MPGAAASAPQARLGNNASKSSAQDPDQLERRKKSKRRRYELRGKLWQESTLDRVRKCGRCARGDAVGLRAAGGEAGFSGVVSCGSVWVCPVCAAKIAAERAGELGKVLSWATDQGHTVALITLTMRHHAGQSLKDCWDAAGTGWSRVTQGRRWAGENPTKYAERAAKWEADRAAGWKNSRRRPRPVRSVGLVEKYGVLGFARAVEALHGENGWHVHIHAVLVLDGPVSDVMVRQLGEQMYIGWEAGLSSKGFTAIRDSGGLDIRTANDATKQLAAYLAKQLAVEATHGYAKQGRNNSGNRAPFQILADVFEHGDADDLDTWHEWEQGSRGRKQLSWSEGIRELAGLAERERTDEEIAEDDLGNEDLLMLDGDSWRAVRDDQIDLLEVAASGGLKGAMRWLDRRSITYTITPAGMIALGQAPARQQLPELSSARARHTWPGISVRRAAVTQ